METKQCQVFLSRTFEKQLKKVPSFIKEAVAIWVASAESEGLTEIRKAKGYHDELLKGTRKGQRSVRLNRAYRLIYTENNSGIVTIILLLEVHKHEY